MQPERVGGLATRFCDMKGERQQKACRAPTNGMRKPNRILQYRGQLGSVNASPDKQDSDCLYCQAFAANKPTQRALRI